jgi:6-phosphogluconolactonase
MKKHLHKRLLISNYFSIWILLPILIFHACSPRTLYLVYVGTYTGHGSDGIYACRFNPENGDLRKIGLAAKTDNPSFIAIDRDGKFLYTVNELDSFENKPTGAVSVCAINRETGALNLRQQISSLGAAPAHLSLDKQGQYLMVANYNGGNVTVFPIERDGKLGPHSAFIQNTGSGINPDRQSGPHAHFIHVTNDNRFVMVADLGIDKVLVFRFNAKTGSLIPVSPGFAKFDPGSGPRHLAFTPSGKYVYVLNELTSTITSFSFDPATGMMEKGLTASTVSKNFSGKNTAAEIVADAKGKFLYVSNRGENNIGLFSINSNDGKLTPVEWISSGGMIPRNIVIDPTGNWLFAANQDSDNIVIFRIDQITGKLIQTSQTSGIDSPVCIRFMPTK